MKHPKIQGESVNMGELVAVPGKVYAELARCGGQAEADLGFQIENLNKNDHLVLFAWLDSAH